MGEAAEEPPDVGGGEGALAPEEGDGEEEEGEPEEEGVAERAAGGDEVGEEEGLVDDVGGEGSEDGREKLAVRLEGSIVGKGGDGDDEDAGCDVAEDEHGEGYTAGKYEVGRGECERLYFLWGGLT